MGGVGANQRIVHPVQQPLLACSSVWNCPGVVPSAPGRPAACSCVHSQEHQHELESTITERTDLVVSSDLAHEIAERLVDVQALLRGRLNEPAAKVFCEVTALCSH